MPHNTEIIANPTKYFTTPQQLYQAPTLSTQAKIQALENWLDEVKQLTEATYENMPGPKGEDANLDAMYRDINALIAQLNQPHD